MPRKLSGIGMVTMWVLAFAVAIGATRYFLAPVPLLLRGQTLALSRHPHWLPLHIAGGMVAMIAGLFQFVGALRNSYPTVHRAMGYAYLVAVLVAGSAGLWLSPDTATFATDGLTEGKAFDLSSIGLSPAFLGYGPSSTYLPSQFFPVVLAFATLSIAWLLTSALAFVCARQRRFDLHRAWMMRSYSLTFAAVTVRLIGLPLLVLTRNPVVAVTCTFWSWILNLMVAEWLIRRTAPRERDLASAAIA
jgi:Predicted membrane protein (DUF2306)